MSKQSDKDDAKILADEKADEKRKAKEKADAEKKVKESAEAARLALIEKKKLDKEAILVKEKAEAQAKIDADAKALADQKAKEKAEAKEAADKKAKEDALAKQTVTLPKGEFAKLYYSLVTGPAALGQWTQIAGRNRIARMLGAKTDAECEKVWLEFRGLAQT